MSRTKNVSLKPNKGHLFWPKLSKQDIFTIVFTKTPVGVIRADSL